MRSSHRNDYQLLSEHYNKVYQQKMIEESIDCLEHNLKFCVEQARVDEGLAGLATRTKDRMAGALSGAGAAMKNVGAMAQGVTRGKIGDLQDPRAAANQKKIQNVLNRFNKDITALVPDLKQQQPELSAAIDQLNQAAQQQPAPAAGTPPEAAGTPPEAAGTPPEAAPSAGTPPQADPGKEGKNKEGFLSKVVKAPGRMLSAAERKAKDLEARTAASGIEGLLPGYTDPNAKKQKQNLKLNRDKNKTYKLPTGTTSPSSGVTSPATPAAETPPATPDAEEPAAETPPVEQEPAAEPVDPTAARAGIDAAYDNGGSDNYNTQTGEKKGAQTGNLLNKYAADLKAAQQSGDKKTMNIVAKDILAYATSTQHQGGQADTVKRGAKELLKRLGMPQANSQQLNECINRLLNSMTVLIREQNYLKYKNSNILGGCGFMNKRWGNFS